MPKAHAAPSLNATTAFPRSDEAAVALPWCEDCAKFWNPNTMPPDGTCPTCGRFIAEPVKPQRIPWHFWVLLAAAAIYLGWRAIQGVQWLLSR